MKLGLLGAKSICVLIFGLAMATSAQAVTVAVNGSTHAIGPGEETEFIGIAVAADGEEAGSWLVNFEATTTGGGSALTTISFLVGSVFDNLTMSWINTDNDDVLATTPIFPITTTLSTNFTNPDTLNQTLLISWDSALDGAGA